MTLIWILTLKYQILRTTSLFIPIMTQRLGGKETQGREERSIVVNVFLTLTGNKYYQVFEEIQMVLSTFKCIWT